MSSQRQVRMWRLLVLLALMVFTQACGQGTHGAQTPAATNVPVAPDPYVMGMTVQRAANTALASCNGDAFTIDVLDAIASIPDDTLEVQREQLRDWTWTVTLGRIAQKMGADEVLSSVADEPLRRDEALEHALYMQTGPARSAATKQGDAIVLVEQADDAKLRAQMFEAIDQETLHLGHTPKTAHVYQYAFRPEVARVEVCAMKPLDAAEIESEANGYRMAAIKKPAQLETFLSGGVDLLSARCTNAGLQVTGRQRPRHQNLPFTVEHVAALNQPMGVGYVPPERFGTSLAHVPFGRKFKLEDAAQQIDAITEDDKRLPEFARTILAWKKKNPGVSTENLLLSMSLQDGYKDVVGFSLDPIGSFRAEDESTKELLAALPNAALTAELLRSWGEDSMAAVMQNIARKGPHTNALFDAIRDQLRFGLEQSRAANQAPPRPSSSQRPYNDPTCIEWQGHRVCNVVVPQPTPIPVAPPTFLPPTFVPPWQQPAQPQIPPELVRAFRKDFDRIIWEHSAQQCARYDGPLAGTAAGMTFFYTDLLAKLWSIDWQGTAPDLDIEGFESLVRHSSSTAACQEEAPPSNTRLWFGLRNEGYSRELPDRLRFAPVASRIFAKGSHTKAGESEGEPNAQSRRFIQWWDRHFARIAAWEPQYEVLNQLMKWSVVVQTARITKSESCVAFLHDVAIEHGHRFDKWVQNTKDLRRSAAVSLVSHPEKPTECIPLLKSKDFASCGSEGHYLIGGVTAATIDEVQAKPTRKNETVAHLGRLGGGAYPSINDAEHVRFEPSKDDGGHIRSIDVESNHDQTKVSASLHTSTSQRGALSSWLKDAPIVLFEKLVKIRDNRLEAKQSLNGLVSDELTTSDLTAADIKLDVKPSTISVAKSMAQGINAEMQLDNIDLVTAARTVAGSLEVHRLDTGDIAVKLEGTKPPVWALMESGGGNRGPPVATVAAFHIGVPSGAPFRTGSARNARNPVLNVYVYANPGFETYLRAHRREQLTPVSPPESIATLKQTGGDEMVAQMVQNAIAQHEPAFKLRAYQEGLSRAAVQAERAGQNAGPLHAMNLKLAFEQRRRLTPAVAEAPSTSTQDAAVYAPTSYPQASELPPAVFRYRAKAQPSASYVSRVIEEASADALPYKFINGDTEYVRVNAGNSDKSGRTTVVGSAYRLLYPRRVNVHIVTPCFDHNRDWPRCNEDLTKDERENREFFGHAK